MILGAVRFPAVARVRHPAGQCRWGWIFAVQNIVHLDGKRPKEPGIADAPANEIMHEVIRVRIRTDTHTAAAVRTKRAPDCEACFRIDLPAPYAIDRIHVSK